MFNTWFNAGFIAGDYLYTCYNIYYFTSPPPPPPPRFSLRAISTTSKLPTLLTFPQESLTRTYPSVER